jgi:cyclic beta-1,2-glucan synthetase
LEIFSEGRAEFRGREHDFDTHTEVAVSAEDDIELRRITITSRARTRRTIDVTSYAEWVLGELRPKSSMHVITEIDPNSGTLFARNPYNCRTLPEGGGGAAPEYREAWLGQRVVPPRLFR